MRRLSFGVKHNLKRAPRIHIKSSETGTIYGSFPADAPEKFDGWDAMSKEETVELKQYIDNLNAVKRHTGVASLNELSDYRLRLPLSLSDTIDAISILSNRDAIECDIYESMVSAIIQTLKIAVAHMKGDSKVAAVARLDQLGLATYEQLDYHRQIQTIFSEVLTIYNKSEKLHQQAVTLFNKDKSFSPHTIAGMAEGKSRPSLWLVACAISVLLDENPEKLHVLLSEDDYFKLLAKPMIDHKRKTVLTKTIKKYGLDFLKKKIDAYCADK